jgi:hypothetical protein
MSRQTLFVTLAAVSGIAFLAGCQEQAAGPDSDVRPQFAKTGGPAAQAMTAMLEDVNAALDAQGAPIRAAMVEYITVAGSDEAGATILQKDVGNKQLTADFVPFDARRAGWSGPGQDITYAVDQTGDAVPVLGGLAAAQTDAAIDRAMGTWADVNCSVLPITRNPDFGIDIGVVAFLNGLGGSGFVVADVQHAGFRDINFAGGILGVTFTFVWIDDAGDPTDIDNNGKADVAFREIYYDPSFPWADNGVANVDVETVAVHEAGHGLSQGHFGNIIIRNNGQFTASPRAVMNAAYQSPFRVLRGTDIGGHCSNWAQWPNN